MNTINNMVLLLTGCINPNGMAHTVLQDPDIRKRQYISAIRYYLENTKIPIVFIENTNTDISGEFFTADYSRRIEFITFNGNNFDKSKGKGYGEALMIEYALTHSKFINDNTYIVKITGRLIIENLEELIQEMKSSECVYASLVRGKYGMERKSYFFGAPKSFLSDYFLFSKEKIDENEGTYFENHLFNESLEWVHDGGKAKEFKLPILVNGISGSNGKKYPTEHYPYLKAWLRYYLHKLPIYK